MILDEIAMCLDSRNYLNTVGTKKKIYYITNNAHRARDSTAT